MKVIATEIPDVLVVEPKLLGDQRGFFFEAFHAQRYAEHGIPGPFVQDNLSRSGFGVIRGLHLQNPSTQGKLVSVLRGPCMERASSKAKWESAMQVACTLLCEPRGYTVHMAKISSGL